MFLKTLLNDFLNLISPNCCVNCKSVLETRRKGICDECKKKILYTNYHLFPNSNKLFYELFKNVDITAAYTMCFFQQDNPIQSLIHHLKYYSCTDIGVQLGEMYGKILQSNFAGKFDVIIPMPIHKNRQSERGFNQCDFIALGLNNYLHATIDTTSIIRYKDTPSQTHLNKQERHVNMQDAFKVITPEKLDGKYILLIDDIITTGSTVISCANEILNHCECSVSICVIAKDIYK